MRKLAQMQASFAAGELAPNLYARVDLEKFATGLRTCRNFVVNPTGGVSNRAGFVFVAESGDSTNAVRIFPFEFNDEQTYILEFGNLYIRVIKDGAQIVEADVATTEASNAGESGVRMSMLASGSLPASWAVAKHVFITGNSGSVYGPYKIDQLSGTTVYVTEMDGTLPNLMGVASQKADLQTGTVTMQLVYQVTSTYTAAQLFDIGYTQSADTMTLAHPAHPPRELTRTAHSNWTLTDITFGTTVATPASPTATATGSGAGNYSYKVTAIIAGQESLPTAAATCTNGALGLTVFNTIGWSVVSGAEFYNVYKKIGGVHAFAGSADSNSFVDDGIVPTTTITPEVAQTIFNTTDEYPSTVAYYQQRIFFGRTNNNVSRNRASQTGNFKNFNKSEPVRDSDAIDFELAETKVNAVKHYVPLEDLIILTTDGEWRITGSTTDAITPSSIAAKPQGFNGSSKVPPLVINNSALFITPNGDTIRDMEYSLTSNTYSGGDLTTLSHHLFDGYTLVDWTYQKSRDRVVWAVRSDGTLLGMSYLPDEDVWAWHRHDTGATGLFESIACVTESGIERAYAVVKRTIDSRVVRYIEQLHTRDFSATTAADSVFLDSSLATTAGGALTTIYGLEWLEGQTVGIVVAGRVQPQAVVTNGALSVTVASGETVCIGVPIQADIRPLPMDPEGTVPNKKMVANMTVRVRKTRGIQLGPTSSDLIEVPETISYYDTAPDLFTGDVEVIIATGWEDHVDFYLRQDHPLPVEILAIIPEVGVGGT